MRRRILASLIVLALLVSLVPAGTSTATQSSPESYSAKEPGTPVRAVPAPLESESPPPENTDYHEVTLITGDVVIVWTAPTGERGIAIRPANPEPGQSFLVVEHPAGTAGVDRSPPNTDTYVFPDGVDFGRLDMELFNVDYLIREDYHELAYLPVLVSSKELVGVRGLDTIENSIAAVADSFDAYPWLSTVATQLSLETVSNAYQTLLELDVVEKVWLDRKVHSNLHDSVPLIGSPEVWDSGYTGSGMTIAILDTGIDDTHPDLDDLDDDPLTTDPKVLCEVNFTDDPTAGDGYGHGTHCASIAAGTGGGRTEEPFYVGVAPGAWLYNVKVLNQYGSGMSSWIIDGIEYAVLGPDGAAGTGDEADIISMSLGGSPTDGSDPLSQAVNWAVAQGTVVVVAAGNSGDYFTIGAPGAARDAITVGASTKTDGIAYFSSMGPILGDDSRLKPNVLAPGVAIIAARASGTSMGGVLDDLYTSAQGTSMATPHVAGAAALMLQANTVIPLGWSAPRFVKSSLMSGAVDLGYDVYAQGAGRIDVPSAVQPLVLVDPATTSLGNCPADTVVSQELTFYNLDSESHDLDLSATLAQMLSAEDYSGNAAVTPSVLTVPAGGLATATLQVDTTGLPDWLYGGRVQATVDGGPDIVNAVFGMARLSELVVEKTDRNGDAGEGHYVVVFNDEEQSWLRQGWTDVSGRATFYVPSGEYQVASRSYGSAESASVWNFGTATVAGTGFISLDDRNTVPVDFDPNKPDQVIAEKYTRVGFQGESTGVSMSSLWRYPGTALTYISLTASWASSHTYSYYPEAYLNYEALDTPEWAKLRYGLDEITGPVTFVADYDNLVTRQTLYRTTLEDEEARRVQWATGPPISGG